MVFIWHESWPLIQMKRFSTVVQKSPSQTVKIMLHRLIASLSLGWRCDGYKDDHPTGIKLECSILSGNESDGLLISI